MILASRSSRVEQAAASEAPHWVNSLLTTSKSTSARIRGIDLQSRNSDRFALISAQVLGARELSAAAFEQCVVDAYGAIAQASKDVFPSHAVRFWNCIPDIHRLDDEGIERYMRFNRGRFQAFCQWFGQESFAQRVPTASAVGHAGDELVIHALFCAREGRPVANPRQIAPYQYSHRYGPLPPCFARATIVECDGDQSLILVGGTASIRGEETVHPQNFRQQVRETLANMSAVLSAAHTQDVATRWQRNWLHQLREIRVFIPRATSDHDAAREIAGAFPKVRRIEMVRAELCRSDLLIEIEGLAETNC